MKHKPINTIVAAAFSNSGSKITNTNPNNPVPSIPSELCCSSVTLL